MCCVCVCVGVCAVYEEHTQFGVHSPRLHTYILSCRLFRLKKDKKLLLFKLN